MKKFFTLLLVALFSIATNAQMKVAKTGLTTKFEPQQSVKLRQQQQTNSIETKLIHRTPRRKVESQGQLYSASGITASFFGDVEFSCVPVNITISGDKYYISGLFSEFEDFPAIEFTKKGNILTNDNTQMVYTIDYTDYDMGLFDCYVGECVWDEDGENIIEAKPFSFTIKEDGTIESTDPDAYLTLYDNEGGVYTGWGYYYSLAFSPVTEDLTMVTLPNGVEAEPYIFSAVDAYGGSQLKLDSAIVVGNDIYARGLCDEWIKGSVSGDKVFFPTEQYIGTSSGYFAYFYTGKLTPSEEDPDYYDVTPTEGVTFALVDGKYIQTDDTYILCVTRDGEALGYISEASFYKYEGDVAAVPVDPVFTDYSFESGEGYDYISYSIPNVGTNGEFLNPEHLYLRFWYDDQVYEFDPSIYTVDVTTATTAIPWTQFSYNMYFGGKDQTLYLYDTMFEKIGVQAVYNGANELHVSNIVYIDGEGNTSTVEVDHDPDTIVAVQAASKNSSIFDLQGRKVEKLSKGIFVINGRKVVK